MLIYHGSEHIIKTPSFYKGNYSNDYGKGFYCTQEIELAREWACKKGQNGFVNAEAFRNADRAEFAQKWLEKTREHMQQLIDANGPVTIITNGERDIFDESEYPEDTVFAETVLVFANNHAVLADSHMGLENDHMYVEFLSGIEPDVEIRR